MKRGTQHKQRSHRAPTRSKRSRVTRAHEETPKTLPNESATDIHQKTNELCDDLPALYGDLPPLEIDLPPLELDAVLQPLEPIENENRKGVKS